MGGLIFAALGYATAPQLERGVRGPLGPRGSLTAPQLERGGRGPLGPRVASILATQNPPDPYQENATKKCNAAKVAKKQKVY